MSSSGPGQVQNKYETITATSKTQILTQKIRNFFIILTSVKHFSAISR